MLPYAHLGGTEIYRTLAYVPWFICKITLGNRFIELKQSYFISPLTTEKLTAVEAICSLLFTDSVINWTNIGDDQVNSYVMFNNFHTGRDKSSILTTNISVWCSNTFLNALKDNSQFKIGITHRIEFTSELEELVKSKIQ